MKCTKILCGLALASSLVATNAYAETHWTGFETRLGLTATMVDVHSKGEAKEDQYKGDKDGEFDHAKDIAAGVSGTISFGYRWDLFGVYLEQEIGGVWLTGDSGDKDKGGDDKSHIIGGSYLTGRVLLALRHDCELDFDLGVGTMYSSEDKKKQGALVSDKKGESSAAFAIKAGVGFTYYLIPNTVGIGINFDYHLGINMYETDTHDWTRLIHVLNPGLHANIQF